MKTDFYEAFANRRSPQHGRNEQVKIMVPKNEVICLVQSITSKTQFDLVFRPEWLAFMKASGYEKIFGTISFEKKQAGVF